MSSFDSYMSNYYMVNPRQRKPLTPYIVLPYYPTDDGSRPLPPTVSYWRCAGILVNGSPYAGHPLTSGTTIALSVTVRNIGALATSGVARIYWAHPATAFNANTVNLIGQAPFFVVKGQTLVSQVINWVPDHSVPAHVCLLAEVTCVADPALFTFNAHVDRHYGQQNLNLISAQPATRSAFSFFAVNPQNKPNTISVRVAPASDLALRYLASEFHGRPVRLDEKFVSLREVEPGRLNKGRTALLLKLDSYGTQLCQVMFRMPNRMLSDGFVALEVFQGEAERAEEDLPSLAIMAFVKA
jgi:hypothetical protein